MDCMDMVIGVARGNLGRVGDFYTRDRSTPREDSFWVKQNFYTKTIPYTSISGWG